MNVKNNIIIHYKLYEVSFLAEIKHYDCILLVTWLGLTNWSALNQQTRVNMLLKNFFIATGNRFRTRALTFYFVYSCITFRVAKHVLPYQLLLDD